MGVFLISENRSPQATLAWMLAFILAPGLGVVIYFLFGRGTKAFSRQSTLLQQDLAATAVPVLSPIVPVRMRRSNGSGATVSTGDDSSGWCGTTRVLCSRSTITFRFSRTLRASTRA
jgi:hypothetical protein